MPVEKREAFVRAEQAEGKEHYDFPFLCEREAFVMTDHWWNGRVVWVSGATGAWGQECVRQLLALPVRKVVAFARGEHRMAALRETFPDGRLRCHLGDVRDARLVPWSLRDADVVIHLAALKRIESGGESPTEMVSVNIDGTQNIISAVLNSPQREKRAMFVSSDKACEPTTFYGATKMVAEELWRGANVYSPSPAPPWFVAMRFGNVLGSTGSVLEVWRRQRARGEPLTIYMPDATRFVLTKREAVMRLLTQVESVQDSTKTLFAPSRLMAASVIDLAHAFAGNDYPLEIRGDVRGNGEKRHERLLAHGLDSSQVIRYSVPELRQLLAAEGLL
jgi:FlaA1/EpsC-like NDP-sugar epimerase